MKPLLVPLSPYLSEVPWGGAALQRHFGVDAPLDRKIGEAWVISAIPGKASRVLGTGQPLDEVWRGHEAHFLGPGTPPGTPFPFLVKLLATEQPLSVQVHPDDATAERLEGSGPGKHEAWVVLRARHGAEILIDLVPGATREQLVACAAASDGDGVRGCLGRIEPCAGDVIDLRPGTVHAPGAGLVLFEVQQQSDVTYRVFDWNRLGLDGKPRLLHVDKAKATIVSGAPRLSRLAEMGSPCERVLNASTFSIERWVPANGAHIPITSLAGITCVAGRGTLSAGGGDPVDLAPGRAVLVPRAATMVEARGDGIVLLVARPARRA